MTPKIKGDFSFLEVFEGLLEGQINVYMRIKRCFINMLNEKNTFYFFTSLIFFYFYDNGFGKKVFCKGIASQIIFQKSFQ